MAFRKAYRGAYRKAFVGQLGANLNLMESIKSSFAFWSDGTIEGSQLTDFSGNDRHSTVSDNIITDPSAEFGSSLVTFNSGTNTNSTDFAHSGTKSYKFAITAAAAIAGGRKQYFRTKAGETVNFSFWIYATIKTGSLRLQVLKGDGSTGWQNLSATPTIGQWVNYTGSFVDSAGGGIGEVRFYVQSGDLTCYLDDIEITITGETNLGVTMANNATLKAIDTNNLFFTAIGIPITIRSDSDPTIENQKLYCGGALKYIFLDNIPDVNTLYILSKEFINHDWAFDTCEKVLTVGSGKDYSTIQDAITAVSGNTITNRFRIDIYDNFSASVIADYTVVYSGSSKDIFVQNKAFVYFNGVGDITIEGTLPDASTDAEMALYTPCDFLYTGGAKNIKFKKTNGRYAVHIDSGSLIDSDLRFIDCEFYNYGMDDIITYRNTNELPLPLIAAGGVTPLGMGMKNGEMVSFVNCLAYGIHALTNHGGHESGDESYLFMYNNIMTAAAIYNYEYNPTSDLLASMRLDSSPGTNTIKSIGLLAKNTFNVAITTDNSWTVTTK